jgi:hypothetical protein
MYVSKNGFIIPEVYKDLQASLRDGNLEKCCHWMVELVVSGELKSLVNWIIMFISDEYVSTNILFYDFVVKKLNIIKDGKYNWKKSKAIKESIAEIVVCLGKQKSVRNIFFKNDQLGKQKDYVDHICLHAAKEYKEIKDVFSFFIGNSIFTVICHLYEMILRGDARNAMKVFYYIIQKGTIKECETLSVANLEDTISKCKNDSVWLLWQLLYLFGERPEIERGMRTYIDTIFKLFCFEYSKKIRLERMNTLFTCLVICCKRKTVSLHNVYDDFVAKAGQQIHCLFDESLKTEKLQKSIDNFGELPTSTKKQHEPKKVISKGKKTSGMTEEQKMALDEKMKYFFVLTYEKPKTELYMNTKKFDYDMGKNVSKTIDVASWNEIDQSNSQYCSVEKIW